MIGFVLGGRGFQRERIKGVLLVAPTHGAGTLGFFLGEGLALYFLSRFVMGIGSGGLWMGVTFATLELGPGQEYLCMSRIFAVYSVGGLVGPRRTRGRDTRERGRDLPPVAPRAGGGKSITSSEISMAVQSTAAEGRALVAERYSIPGELARTASLEVIDGDVAVEEKPPPTPKSVTRSRPRRAHQHPQASLSRRSSPRRRSGHD
jgi:hypothetical protein